MLIIIIIIIIIIIMSASVEQIRWAKTRSKNTKNGMARGPVLRFQKQNSRVLLLVLLFIGFIINIVYRKRSNENEYKE